MKSSDVNEIQLRLLVENTLDIIYSYDIRGIFTYVSPSVRITGYDQREVIGRPMIEFIHPDDRQAVAEAYRRAVIEGYVRSADEAQPPPLFFRIMKKDGGTVTVEVISNVVRDAVGSVTMVTGILRDITERVRIEEKLRENETRYRMLVENTSDIIFSYDTEKRITYVSPSVKNFGFSADEVVGSSALSFVHPEDHAYVARMMDDVIVNGIDRTVTFRVVLKDGSVRVMEETSKAVHDNDGIITNVTGIMRDVTDRVAMERALKERTEELEVLNRVIIAGSQSSVHDLLPRILDIMLSYIQFPIGACYRIEGNAVNLICQRGISADKTGQVKMLPLSDPEVHPLFTEKAIFEDMIDTKSVVLARLFSIASAAIVPIVSADRVIGAFICAHREPHHFTESEKRILFAVGKEAGANVAKIMADEHSRNIEASLSQKTRGIANAQVLQRNLNTKLLPPIPDIDIAACYMPSEELGGDFFDIRKTGARLTVIIADCSGHGIEASMAATLLKAIADRHIAYLAQGEPEAFLTRVNRDTASYFSEQHFPSMFAATINIGTKEIVYANAGTPPPFIVGGGAVERLAQGKGFLLGYDAHTVYERRSRTLHPGEIIAITSDAFLGIVRNGKIVLDTDGLIPLFARFGRGVKGDINGFLSEISGISPLPLSDDATVILIEHIPPEERHIELRRISEITAASESIGECLVRRGYTLEDVNSVRIAFDELCVNAIEHGNHGNAKKSVVVDAVITCEKTAITVTDEGKGFDPSSVPDPTSPAVLRTYLETRGDAVSRGRGIWITRRITDSLVFTENGSRAAFTKKRRPAHTDFHYATPARRNVRRTPERTLEDGMLVWHSDMTVNDIKGLRSKNLTIDLGDIPMLPSMEIGALIIIHRHCTRKGIALSLISSSDHLKRTLSDLGLAPGS
ncbi:MAG: PAS domain S-box protein [Spirochaetota bacterium]